MCFSSETIMAQLLQVPWGLELVMSQELYWIAMETDLSYNYVDRLSHTTLDTQQAKVRR